MQSGNYSDKIDARTMLKPIDTNAVVCSDNSDRADDGSGHCTIGHVLWYAVAIGVTRRAPLDVT